MRYSLRTGMKVLQEVFVSQAAARQRAGRAGRVRDGTCWRMYPESLFNNPSLVPAFPLPEIQRLPLEDVVLHVLMLQLPLYGQIYASEKHPEISSIGSCFHGPRDFLSKSIEPPSIHLVLNAIERLLSIEAVAIVPSLRLFPGHDGLCLTPLGYLIIQMPVDIPLAVMLIHSRLLNVIFIEF